MGLKIGNYELSITKRDKTPGMSFVGLTDLREIYARHNGAINTSTAAGQALAVAKCSVLSSIISKKVTAIADARFWAKDAEDKDVERPQELARVMRPNAYQTLPEFVCMVEFFTQIFGKAYIYRMTPVGFDESEIFVVPNLMVSETTDSGVAASFKPFADVLKYTITFNGGQTIDVAPDDMFIVRDVTYSLNKMGDSVSRMIPLQDPINTFIASYEATNELLVNRGMLGIISLTSDDPAALAAARPATADDKNELQNQLRKYGVLRDSFKYAITSYRAAYTPVSSTINDLGISTIINSCKKEIAYRYQVPSVMLDIEGATYSNYGEAKLEFYTADIIPSARNIMSVINKIYGFEEFKIMPFFDHLELFQNAKRAQAQGMTALVSALNAAVQSQLMTIEEAKIELNKYLI